MLFLWDFWNLLGHCSPQQPGTWTESQNSKLGIETSMVFVLMCTQAWGPQASLELFLTLPPCFSVSLLGRRPFVNDEEDRGFELCFSPTVKGGLWALAAWSVQRNMSFLFPPSGENGAGPQTSQRKQTNWASVLPGPQMLQKRHRGTPLKGQRNRLSLFQLDGSF